MKTPFLLLAALLLAAPDNALLAQGTTVKTKVKTEDGTSVKTTAPVPAAPSDDQMAARAAALTASMQRGLGLQPPQVEKVQKINLNSMRSVETARQQYRGNLRKMGSVVDDISQARLAALKDVLTPPQFALYQRKREEKMGIPGTSAAQGNPVPGYGE